MKSTSTGQGDGPAQVAHEEHGALQDGHQQGRLLGVVLGDGGAQLGHPGGQAIGIDQHGAHVGRSPRRDARSGLVVGHRRDITGPSDRFDPEAPPGAAYPSPSCQLRPHRAPGGHGQRAVHLGQRGRMAVVAGVPQPAAHGAARQRQRRRGHRLGIGRVGQQLGRQRVEQLHLAAQHAGLPGQQRDRVAPGHLPRTAAGARGGCDCGRTPGRRCSRRTPAPIRPPRTGRASRAGAARGSGAASPAPCPPGRRHRHRAGG